MVNNSRFMTIEVKTYYFNSLYIQINHSNPLLYSLYTWKGHEHIKIVEFHVAHYLNVNIIYSI